MTKKDLRSTGRTACKIRRNIRSHNYSGKDATVYDELDAALSSEFVGYDQLDVESEVTAMTSETEVVDALTDGDKGTIFVEKTPFYATMGGQEG